MNDEETRDPGMTDFSGDISASRDRETGAIDESPETIGYRLACLFRTGLLQTRYNNKFMFTSETR